MRNGIEMRYNSAAMMVVLRRALGAAILDLGVRWRRIPLLGNRVLVVRRRCRSPSPTDSMLSTQRNWHGDAGVYKVEEGLDGADG